MTTSSLKQLRTGLHFSASALKSFLMCPWKFRLQYVEGAVPEFRPSAMVLGRAVHQALAEYHLAVQAKRPCPETRVLEHLDAAMDSEGKGKIPIRFKDGEGLDGLRKTGKGLVEVYVKQAEFRKIVAIEQPFRASLIDPRTGEELEPKLVGVFDLIEKDEEGNVSVVEIKTAARKWSAGQIDLDLQTSLYSEAVVQAGLVPEGQEARIEYRVLVKNKTPVLDRQFAVTTPGDRKMAVTIAVDALNAIERDSFYRNPSWACSGCSFRKQCGI